MSLMTYAAQRKEKFISTIVPQVFCSMFPNLGKKIEFVLFKRLPKELSKRCITRFSSRATNCSEKQLLFAKKSKEIGAYMLIIKLIKHNCVRLKIQALIKVASNKKCRQRSSSHKNWLITLAFIPNILLKRIPSVPNLNTNQTFRIVIKDAPLMKFKLYDIRQGRCVIILLENR